MSDDQLEFLASGTARDNTVTLPQAAAEKLGDADRIAWFVNHNDGTIVVVPETEVGLK